MVITIRKKKTQLRMANDLDRGNKAVSQLKVLDDKSDEMQSAGLYESFFEKMYDAVLIVDGDSVIRRANDRAVKFFSYSRQELVGMTVFELISGFEKSMFLNLHAHIYSGRYTVINASCVRKDRRSFSSDIALSAVDIDAEQGLAFAIRSDARKEKIRAKLRTEHNALQNAGCAIAIADIDNKIEFVNKMFLDMWGFEDEDQVRGIDAAKLWADTDAVHDLLERPAAGQAWNGELEAKSRDEKRFWVQATSSSNLDESGAVIGVIFSFVDISERYRAQEAIRREAQGQIDEARAREEFSGLLNIITIQDLFQLIDSTGKTGKLTLWDSNGDIVGWSIFSDGKIIGAECDRSSGEDAVVQMLGKSASRFEFKSGLEGESYEPSIDRSTMGVLLDASRRVDELTLTSD